ncbi:MAG: hypothetical protein HYU30_07355 [Chloroflexi bacterium]|nr:hypothetical protein [Chloroflexota bacterium]
MRTRPPLDAGRIAAIDQHALDAPDSAEQSIKALASYLVSPAQDDVEKARAIYRWITDNIAYDFASYLSKRYPDQSAEAVMKRRTGVCSGYANLFAALGKAAGLQVEVISGWSKGYAYVNNTLDEEPNHAWNAVRLDGGWYLVESTWGAGFISEEKQFVRRFDGYYFLTSPQELIFDHYPVDSRWQLLVVPVAKQEFLSLPRVWPEFFENGIGLESHRQAGIRANREVDVTLSAPLDALLLVTLHRGEEDLSDLMTFVQRSGGDYHVKAAFPGAGEYRLTVFSKKASDQGPFHSTLEYTVAVAVGDPSHPGFPKVWPAFFDNQLGFVSHSGGMIAAAGEVLVTLSAPPDVLLLASLSRDGQELSAGLTFVQRKGADYNVSAAFPTAGRYALTIFSKRARSDGLYKSSLEYTLQVSKGAPGLSYPTTYSSFSQRGVVLYSPFSGTLPLGSTQTFRLQVPGAEQVAVIIDEQWHYLNGDGGLFEGYVAIDGQEIGVYAKFPGNTQFSGLLNYTSGPVP